MALFNIKKISCILLIGGLFAGVTACTSGDDGQTVQQDHNQQESISGVFDFSPGNGDEQYLYVAPNGDLEFYDYKGDDFDRGPECFEKFTDQQGAVRLVSLEEDGKFRLEYTNGSSRIVNIEVSESGMNITSESGQEDYFSKLNELSVDDLAPLCDFTVS